MHLSTIPLLRCPATGGPLSLIEPPDSEWIETGTLRSIRSGATFAIRDGMAHIYVDDQRWAPKAQEARGWVQMARDLGFYHHGDEDLRLPYFGAPPWIDIARQFDILLDIAEPGPGTRVLDLGAGRGWAAHCFARRGCQAFAVDICDDAQIGLGRARAMMAQSQLRFDTFIADGENLPFANDSFDFVFSAAALHHATDLQNCLSRLPAYYALVGAGSRGTSPASTTRPTKPNCYKSQTPRASWPMA
ncbi:methyltransferase domain-containing protein [Candidatus Gracilibacteria bacterium]|nr:methyltransferase domain-containing protein [Candidatus Gracilibacteria bacterium]